jgi:hypothetical protein
VAGAEYQFVAWARMGIGARLGGEQRIVRLELGANGSVSKPVTAYGPDAVTSLDPRAFVRTVPHAGASDFEPNLFASVELAHPGLPWMVSTAPDASGRVTPWLVLIVVEEQPGVALGTTATGELTLSIEPPAVPAKELPDLRQAWAWAHAQSVGAASAVIDPKALAHAGGGALARLVAARRLEPARTYIACVVPSYASGALAWSGSEDRVRLRVFYSWRFGTGPGGDFASLVKLLQAEKLAATVGHRTIDASAPGWGMPASPGAALELGGALRSEEWTPAAASADVVALGTAIVAEIDAAAVPPPGQAPVYPPPCYGSAATTDETSATAPTWQIDMNRDVAQRIAAGFGAVAVRASLDSFVAAAWSAAGDAERANRAIRQAELAAAVTDRLVVKHIAPIADDGELLAIARPLLSRMRVRSGGLTVAAALRASAMPDAALEPAWRRLARPAGVLARANASARTGVLMRQLDARAITAVPRRALASGAVALDEIIGGEREPHRLSSVTADAIESARADWQREIEPRSPTLLARSGREVEVPEGEERWTPDPISRHPDRIRVDAFALAARRHQTYIVGKLETISDRVPPSLGDLPGGRPLAGLRATIEQQWTAERGIVPLLASRFEGVDATVLDGLGTFQPIRITPVLEQPLVRALAATDVMPGVETLLANRVTVAVTGPEFVRACLVGANEELGRELLWRGLPTALGHTWLRTFWGRTALDAAGLPVGVPDIDAIEDWPDAGPTPTPATLVLLVRGEVLRRYPNALVYALEARWEGRYRVVGEGEPLPPVFAATLAGDIALFGFDLAADTARGHDTPPDSPGWYFVIAEHPHEPRFGLAATPESGDIAWAEVGPGDLAGAYLRVDGPLAATHPTWGTDAARMAALTLRRLVRVARHASTLMV